MRMITNANVPHSQREQRRHLAAQNPAKVYFQFVMQKLHDLCKQRKLNPAKELRLLTGHHISVCERYVAEKRHGSFKVAGDLILSSDGPEFIRSFRDAALALGKPVPNWLDDFEAFCAVAQAMRAQSENRKQAENLRRLNDKL
jgi:hypothetical protein